MPHRGILAIAAALSACAPDYTLLDQRSLQAEGYWLHREAHETKDRLLYEEARHAYSVYLERFGDGPGDLTFYFAELCSAQRRWDDAIALYERALEALPREHPHRMDAAYAVVYAVRRKQNLDAFGDAADPHSPPLGPSQSCPTDTGDDLFLPRRLCLLLAPMERYVTFKQAPGRLAVLYRLGLLYEGYGSPRRALAHYNTIVEDYPIEEYPGHVLDTVLLAEETMRSLR